MDIKLEHKPNDSGVLTLPAVEYIYSHIQFTLQIRSCFTDLLFLNVSAKIIVVSFQFGCVILGILFIVINCSLVDEECVHTHTFLLDVHPSVP